MAALEFDDVLLAAQENDFVYFPGKLEHTARLAKDHGLRPIAIFWGALNLFGGGRSSQFLLEHPEGFQKARDGAHRAAGCYVNPVCVSHIQSLIDAAAAMGYEGYFVDEPTPLTECFCGACRERYREHTGGALEQASEEELRDFRESCVIEYVKTISAYCKERHPHIETMCCLMPTDQSMWEAAAGVAELDNLGSDLYWVNSDRAVAEMGPILSDMDALCKGNGKVHHEWFQAWRVQRGREDRIRQQGMELVRAQPDAVYVWAWKAQVGTNEASEDPHAAWSRAVEVLRAAKRGGD
jgi:hypothetical protein